MVLAVLSVRPPPRVRGLARWVRAHSSACWWIALVAFVLVTWLGPRGPVGSGSDQQFMIYLLGPFVSVPLLATAIFVAGEGWPARFLARRRFMWIGLVSYGIFLWHVGVLWALQDLGVTKALTPYGLIPLFVLVFGISVGIAALSYRFIERPFYALKDRPLRLRRRAGRSTPSARARAAGPRPGQATRSAGD